MNEDLNDFIQLMHQTFGRDISIYEESFLMKSIEKRLVATGVKTVAAYGKSLVENDPEAEVLFHSLNITYSEFFRNPLTFALLEQLILPTLIEQKEKIGQKEIRIWSAACAAGEEAYSLAIVLDELITARGEAVSFRIFATDISETNLASARRGVYCSTAVQKVPLRHIHLSFTRQGECYSVLPRLKERIDFSSYDLLDEHSVCPPISIYGDFDLVLASNLLFYYKPEIRRILVNKIKGSLAAGGYLVTGEAERAIVEIIGGFRVIVAPSTVFQKTERRR